MVAACERIATGLVTCAAWQHGREAGRFGRSSALVFVSRVGSVSNDAADRRAEFDVSLCVDRADQPSGSDRGGRVVRWLQMAAAMSPSPESDKEVMTAADTHHLTT